MITVESLLQQNYKHVNIYDTDLYINEDGNVYRANKRSKKIKLCSNNKPYSNGYKIITLTNNQRKRKMFLLNRLVYLAFNPSWDIFDSSSKNVIDHINRNPLDDKISNLRNVTNQHNQFNRNGKGYSYHKPSKKYEARIRLNGKLKYLGLFENEQDAEKAYLDAKPTYHIIVEL